MKTFFTILYIPINTTFDEKVSIGLIMSDNDSHYFKYSSTKLSVIKGLLNNQSHSILKDYLKSLDKEINQKENLNDSIIYENNNWVNESYISYLSKYSNNLIQFSKPTDIKIELSKDSFKLLFEKYIYKFEEEISETVDLNNVFEKVRKYLYPAIADKVNIERTITSNDFENLFASIEVNFIGKNGAPVSGHTFDFEKKHYFLENDLTRYVSLTKAIDLDIKEAGKYFVLGREPQKAIDKNHSLWRQIRDSDFLEFVDIDEVGIIEDYIINNNVSPLFND